MAQVKPNGVHWLANSKRVQWSAGRGRSDHAADGKTAVPGRKRNVTFGALGTTRKFRIRPVVSGVTSKTVATGGTMGVQAVTDGTGGRIDDVQSSRLLIFANLATLIAQLTARITGVVGVGGVDGH
jgi:hypothetical protein